MTTPAATSAPPTLRQRLEQILLVPPWRAVTLDRLYDLLPDCTHDQVRGSLKNLVKRGLVITQGTQRKPVYQGVMGTQPATTKTAKPAMPNDPPQRAVIWPEGLQVQVAPPSMLAQRGTWTGPDWTHATQRPGCQDHLQYQSRRGDQRVPHQPQLSGCVGNLRDKRGNGR